MRGPFSWREVIEKHCLVRSVKRQPDMSVTGLFVSLPVVELRTVIQSTGVTTLVLRKQTEAVDSVGTRTPSYADVVRSTDGKMVSQSH